MSRNSSIYTKSNNKCMKDCDKNKDLHILNIGM